MKTTIISFCILLFSQITGGQDRYMTREGRITFYSHTIVEDITAINENVGAVIDTKKGAVAIIVPMNEFQFKIKLMQEHFNENYVESEIYPKGTFSGIISGIRESDYQTSGDYQVSVKGEMTIHGISRKVSTDGVIEIRENSLTARTKFLLNPEDYGIKIPRVVRKNIAEKMEITAVLVCDPM